MPNSPTQITTDSELILSVFCVNLNDSENKNWDLLNNVRVWQQKQQAMIQRYDGAKKLRVANRYLSSLCRE